MREFKFRAWNGYGMEYGGFSIHATGKVLICKGLTKVRPDSPVMQCTELKDCNGRDIYEGDIIQMNKGRLIVIYQAPSFIMKETRNAKTWSEFILSPEQNQFGEIIGNIYENPELIPDG